MRSTWRRPNWTLPERRMHDETAASAFLKWRLRWAGGDRSRVESLRRCIVSLGSQQVVE